MRMSIVLDFKLCVRHNTGMSNMAYRQFSKAAPGSQAWIDQNRAGGFTDQKYNQVSMFYAGSLAKQGFTPKRPPPAPI